MNIVEQINNDLKEAMKAKNKVALEAIRNIKKYILEAQTAPGAETPLSDQTVQRIIQKLVKQGKDSLEIYRSQGREDLAAEEAAQVEVLQQYLPKQLGEEEVAAVVKEIIAQTGAAGMKDMGKVMGVATKQLAGKAEGKTISEIVKRLLA